VAVHSKDVGLWPLTFRSFRFKFTEDMDGCFLCLLR